MSLPARFLVFTACGVIGFFTTRAFVSNAPASGALLELQPTAAAPLKPLTGILEESAMVAAWEQLRRDHGGDQADLQTLYTAIMETKDAYRRRAFRAALIADWALRDPRAGLTYLLEKDAGNATQLMREWMRSDPEAAITGILSAGPKAKNTLRGLQGEIARMAPGRLAEVASALPKSESRWDNSTQDAFAIAAERDPAAARVAAESVTGPLRAQALAGVAKAWAEKDGPAALDWAKAMAPGETRDAALKGALLGWAKTDPVAALDKIDLVPPGGDEMSHASDVGAQVLREAAGRNWDATVKWLIDHPGKLGHSSLNGIQDALSKRLVKDPAATVREIEASGLPGLAQVFGNAVLNEGYQARDAIWTWLDGRPRNAFNQGIRGSLLNAIAWKEPSAAIEFLEKLPDDPENKQLLQRGSQSLLNGGSQIGLLEGFLEHASPKLRPHLLEAGFTYGSAEFASDPQRWIERIDELPEDRRLNALQSVARGWASADPEAAVEWATDLADSSQRNLTLSSIAGAWAHADPHAAATWVDSLAPGPSRDGAAQSLVHALSPQQPETAWSWALSIGESNIRMSTLGAVYQSMRQKDPAVAEQMLQSGDLSADEIKQLKAGPDRSSRARFILQN